MNAELVIEVNDVHKSFKAVQAVRGVSLRIERGQFVALLGPNGAGKTTLVEMIEGIQKPDSGEIHIMGKKWRGNEDELHRIIGISLQETRFIDKLSGGQRQRLALGIALLNNPKILLLDEPTTGLDPNARREVWSILLGLKKRSQTSLILTTHYMEEAERLCDYIVIIDKGRILREGTLNELVDEDHREKMLEFTLEGAQPPLDVLESGAPFPIRWDTANERGTVALDRMETELPEFLRFLEKRELRLKNLECRRKTLDDLFTSLTGRHLHE
jgi:ABC-2 type transport system ATP-binding protein